jgi:hypothetical protein
MNSGPEISESPDWRIVLGGVGFHIVGAICIPNSDKLPKIPDGGLLWLLMPVLAIGGFVVAVIVIATLVVPPQEIKGIMIANGMLEAAADRLAWRFWVILLFSCYLPAYLCSVVADG